MAPELSDAMAWLGVELLRQSGVKTQLTGTALTPAEEEGWWDFHIYSTMLDPMTYALELETDDWPEATAAFIEGVYETQEALDK